MSRDIEVISHLVGSMQEAAGKLEKSVGDNKLEETNKIKHTIFEVCQRLQEELK